MKSNITKMYGQQHIKILPYSLYIVGSSQLVSWPHFCPLQLQHLSPFHHPTFTVTDSSVSLLCSFHNMATVPPWPVSTSFGTWPHCLTVLPFRTLQFSTQCITSLYVLFCCQHWTYRYGVFHCLAILLTSLWSLPHECTATSTAS